VVLQLICTATRDWFGRQGRSTLMPAPVGPPVDEPVEQPGMPLVAAVKVKSGLLRVLFEGRKTKTAVIVQGQVPLLEYGTT
jgi:hypothetical protein